MFLLFAGCVFISYFTTKDWQEHYTRNLIYYTIAGIAAGLVPVLWQRSYIVSNPMLICYALLITIFTKKWWSTKLPDKWWSRFLVPFVLLLVFSTTNFVFNTGLKEYAHVFQLLYYKIIFLGEIPKNPAALPFDARIFWTGNFEGMTLKDFSENFGSATFLLLLIPAAFIVDMILKKRGIQEVFIFFLFIGSMIASILVSRLVIFLTVFTAVGAGLFLFLPERFLQKKDDNIKHKSGEKYLLPILLTLAAYIIVLIPMFMNFQTMKALKPQIDEDLTDRRALFAWINENTKPDDAILSSISDGPMILLYTGRPVILNSQFENSYIRRRTEEFNAALFGSEQDLYNFCLKYDAKYIALANKMVLPTGPGSNRYNACVDDKLPASSAAALINFYPETMTKFSPVYDNNNYRVMRVLYDYDKKITKRVCDSSGCIDQVVYDSDKKEDFTWERGYSSYYDPSLFRREGDFYIGTAETMKKLSDESKIMQDMGQYYGEIMNILQRSRGKVNPSDKVAIENNLDIIRRNVQRALQINPKDFTCYMNLGMLEAQVGNMDKAFDNLSKALEIAPTERELLGLTFDLLGKSKNYDKIMTLGNNLLQKDPESVFILYHLADASLNSQNYAQAYEYANKSINIVNAKKLNLERYNISNGTLYYIRGLAAYNLMYISVARTDLAEYLKTATSPQLKASAEKILSEIKVE
jgi:tetratricopeptide (TPR) repeat protein